MHITTARKLQQVPDNFLIVGIDPHKKRHAAVSITQDLTTHDKFKFDNNRDGLDLLVQRARAAMVKSECRGIMFAIETGGHYWRNIASYLDEHGLPFRFINQYTLKRRREGKDLNRKKNDYRDSEVAAQLLCTGEFVESRMPQGVYAELRAAHNSYRRLVKERTRITNLIKGLLDGVFPEFTKVFKDPCVGTALAILSYGVAPTKIAAMSEEEFIKIINSKPHSKRLMRKRLKTLHEVSSRSIGVKAGANSVANEIIFLAERLCLIKDQIRVIEEKLVELVDETEEGKYLLSIRGLNYIAVAGLIAELGCFKSYRNPKQMIKMAGTNPTEYESAGKRGSHTPMSKQGRPVLRYCAWTAIIPMLRFNPDFRSWAKQRRERPVYANPLGGREIVGAALNRLLRIAFTLVKNQTYYRLPQLTLAID